MSRGRAPLVDRIQRHVEQDQDTGCWVWTGAKSKKRDGTMRPVIQVGGRGSAVVSVARWVCEQRHGPAPSPDHHAGHTCPAGERADCVAPAHLEWMTPERNRELRDQWRL